MEKLHKNANLTKF